MDQHREKVDLVVNKIRIYPNNENGNMLTSQNSVITKHHNITYDCKLSCAQVVEGHTKNEHMMFTLVLQSLNKSPVKDQD